MAGKLTGKGGVVQQRKRQPLGPSCSTAGRDCEYEADTLATQRLFGVARSRSRSGPLLPTTTRVRFPYQPLRNHGAKWADAHGRPAKVVRSFELDEKKKKQRLIVES